MVASCQSEIVKQNTVPAGQLAYGWPVFSKLLKDFVGIFDESLFKIRAESSAEFVMRVWLSSWGVSFDGWFSGRWREEGAFPHCCLVRNDYCRTTSICYMVYVPLPLL